MKGLLLGVFIGFLLIFLNTVQAVDIGDCVSVQDNTTYTLNSSFTTNQSKCFDFSGHENIVIDGNGYYINFTRLVNEHLIHANIADNITIENLKIYDWGFDFYNSNNLVIINNNFTGNSYNFLNNVSNLLISGNNFNDTNVSGDQIVHANFYLTNVTVNNNNFTGYCLYDSLFSGYSTLHNASIYNNFFNTSCSALTLGYKHDDINPYVPSSGDIEVYNNEFYMWNSSEYYAMRSYAWGDVNIYIHDNIFSSEGAYSLYVRPRNLTTTKVEIYNNEFIGGGYTFQMYAFGDLGKINNLTIRNNIFNQIGTGSWTIYIRELGNVTIRDNIVNATDSEFAYYLRDNDGFLTVINETMLKPTTAQGFYVRSSDNVNVRDSRFSGDVWSCGVSGSNVTIFENVNCEGVGIGIRVYSDTNFNVYNSTINGTLDIFTEGNVSFYNTSIDTYDTTTTGYLDVYWLLSVTNPLGSSLEIHDAQSSLISGFSDTTKIIWLEEYYVEPSNVTTETTPHRITAFAPYNFFDIDDGISMDNNREYTVSFLQMPTGYIITQPVLGLIPIVLVIGYFAFIYRVLSKEEGIELREIIVLGAGIVILITIIGVMLSLI